MRIRFWRRRTLPADQREALGRWVRLRFLLLERDPMGAIIGAVTRLTDEGMEPAAAVQLVVGVLREGERANRDVESIQEL